MPPTSPYYGNPVKYEYNPGKAKALLKEAGCLPCKVTLAISTSGSGQMQPLPMNELVKVAARGGRLPGRASSDGLERADRDRPLAAWRSIPRSTAINVSRALQDPFNALIKPCLEAALVARRRQLGPLLRPGDRGRWSARSSTSSTPTSGWRMLTKLHELDERRAPMICGRARSQSARPVAQAARLRAGAELVPGPDADHGGATERAHATPVRHGEGGSGRGSASMLVLRGATHPATRSRSRSASASSASRWSISRRAIRCRRSCRPTPPPRRSRIVKHAYGFDKPLPVQFLIWLGRVLTGDFGMSIATRRPVIHEVTARAVQHASCSRSFAVPLAFSLGYAMGAIAGCFPGRADRPRRHRHRGGRRQPAQLLARHRAGHRLRGRADGCCPPPAWGRKGSDAVQPAALGAAQVSRSCRSSRCR